jgi:hypothetical protein
LPSIAVYIGGSVINVLRMTCAQCGAAVKKGDGRFCSHCGAAHPDRPRIAPEEWSTHRERFDQAARDPQHAVAMELPSPPPPMFTRVWAPSLFLLLWIGMGSFVTSGFARGGGTMVLFPLAIMIGGVIMLGSVIIKGMNNARAPVLRELAVVVDERTQVSSSGTGNDRRTSTSYYATLQFEDGSRRELPTEGPIVGSVTRGDIGLAVMRGDELVDFHRFRL